MSRETEAELNEILALLCEAERESMELYGGFHPKAVKARQRVVSLLDDIQTEPIPIDEDVTLLRSDE